MIYKIKVLIYKCFTYLVGKGISIYLAYFPKSEIPNNQFLMESFYGEKLLIVLNPEYIKYYLPVNIHKKEKLKREFVSNLNWLNHLKKINEHRKTKDMFDLFQNYERGMPYENTNAYKRHIKELEEGKLNIKGEPKKEVLDSLDKIKLYYEKNLKLYKEIKKNGFSLQKDIGGLSSQEIGVAIGENGEVYRYGNGYHRMSIAKFLNTSKIIVSIKLVHVDWYNHCKNKYENKDIVEAIKTELSLIYNISK